MKKNTMMTASRSLAVLAAASICSVSMAGAAFAQDDLGLPVIDETKPVSLTIHKYNGAPVAGPGDGVAIDEGEIADALDGLAMLSGVQFDVYRVVGVDLTTNAGWRAATALREYNLTQNDITAGQVTINVDGEEQTFALELAESVVTADGTATFDEASIGLYVVNENLRASGEITDSNGNVVEASSITPTNPFMVTLPMTQPNDLNAWMYDVNVYPKNAVNTITKSVTDQGTVTSDHEGTAAVQAYQYQINTSVTPGLTAEQVATYVVGDTLDERLVLTGVSVDGMTAGDDYVVWVNDAEWDGEALQAGGAKKVEVVLTTTGIEKAIEAQGATVLIDVQAGAADADGVTEFLNDAMFVPNAGWWEANTGSTDPYDPETDDPNNNDGDPVDPPTSNEVRTLYGALDVTKVDSSDASTLLEGAVFAVYTADETGQCVAANMVDGNLISGGHTTGDDGVVRINGLQTSTFYDNAVQETATVYCLVETKAAPGYNLLAEPISFTIGHTDEMVPVLDENGDPVLDENDEPVMEATVRANLETLTVENVRQNLDNDLPLTGGQGAAAIGGLALLTLGGAGGYLVYRSRQDKVENASA